MGTLFKTYTLSANTAQAVVRNTYSGGAVVTLNITNRGSTSANYRVAISSDQTTANPEEWTVWDRVIYAKDAHEYNGICLNEGEYLIVQSTSSSVAAQVWGVSDTGVTTYLDDIVLQLPPTQFVGRLTMFFMGSGTTGSGVTPSVSAGDINSVNLYSNFATSYVSYSSNRYFLNGWDTDGTKARGIAKYGTGTLIINSDSTFNSWSGSWPVDPPALVNTSNYWTSLAYGAGKWVATVGLFASTQIAVDDGTTWTNYVTPVSGDWRMVRYGGGRWVVLSASNLTLYSTNGTSWTQGGNLPAGATLYDMNFYRSEFWYGNNAFHLITASGTNTLRVTTSTDGVSWTSNTRTLTGLTYGVGTLSAYGNNTYVVIQYGSTTSWTSTDGVTWTAHPAAFDTGFTQYSFSSILFAAGRFFAYSGNPNALWSSVDGITWYKGGAAFISSNAGLLYLPN